MNAVLRASALPLVVVYVIAGSRMSCCKLRTRLRGPLLSLAHRSQRRSPRLMSPQRHVRRRHAPRDGLNSTWKGTPSPQQPQNRRLSGTPHRRCHRLGDDFVGLWPANVDERVALSQTAESATLGLGTKSRLRYAHSKSVIASRQLTVQHCRRGSPLLASALSGEESF